MKKLFVGTVALLSVALMVTLASANGNQPTMRLGIAYSGAANPGGCDIGADDVHPTELRVDCSQRTDATAGARIRYRFLADVGAVRGPATVSADIHQIWGAPCHVMWMDPTKHRAARTLRISVPLGSYCHIRSVSWRQP